MVLPDAGIQNHLAEDGTMAGTAEKGWLASVGATEVTQQLSSQQRKGEVPWILSSGPLFCQHLPLADLIQRPKNKGAWEMQFPLIQSQAKNGKDWIEQMEKTVIATGHLESKHKRLNFLIKGQYNCAKYD